MTGQFAIKPLLYYFDPDQTYDLIGWNLCSFALGRAFNVDHSIKYLNGLVLSRSGGNYSYFEGNQREHILIERFTPWNYPWAEEYSTKLYNFINYYTGTDIYDRSEYTRTYVTETETLNFGSESFYGLILPIYEKPTSNIVQLSIPKTSTENSIFITWLEDVEIVPVDPSFVEPSKVYEKRYKCIETSKTESLQISFNVESLAYCSVVISSENVSLQSHIESQFPKSCLYKNFDDLLHQIKLKIEEAFPRLFLMIETAAYTASFSIDYVAPETGESYGSSTGRQYDSAIRFTRYTYRHRPDYYQSACLLFANNDYWSNGVIYNDLGKKPTFYKLLNGEHFVPLRYFFLVPYSEAIGNDPEDRWWYRGGYHNIAIDIPPPDFSIPRIFVTKGGQTHTGLNPFLSYVPVTSSNIEQLRGTYVSLDGVPLSEGEFNPREYPGYKLYLNANYYDDIFSNSAVLDNTWKISSTNAPHLTGHKSLIRNAPGTKYFLFGVGTAFLPDDPRNSQAGNLVSYKINCIATLNADFSFSFENATFESLGTKYYTTPRHYPITDPSLYFFFYQDSRTVSGQINFNYFIGDSEWNNNPYVIEQSYPAFQKMTDNEVVAVINSLMVDSVRLKEIHVWTQEIHQALKADEYAWKDNSKEVARVANLGYYIERIARVLGISVNPDGTIRTIRQKRYVKPIKSLVGTLPDGWNFGQWGLNKGGHNPVLSGGQEGGNADEYRDGIIYEQRSNVVTSSKYNPDETTISEGGYTLCENFPQLIDEILDDLDKALDWQNLGAGAVPNADGSGKFATFEGLAQLLTETAYMLSRISQHTSQTQVATLVVQAVAYEILRATGQPLSPKTFQVDVGGSDYAVVPYPGLAGTGPTQMEQTGWILENIAPLLGALAKINPPPEPPPEDEDTLDGDTTI